MAIYGNYADIGLGGFISFKGDTYCYQTVDGPNSEISEDIETTNSCSVQKEFTPGIIDGTTITMTINGDPSQPILTSREPGNFFLQLPQKPGEPLRARYGTQAYIKSSPWSIDINDVMTQTVTFKITGDEVWRDGFGNVVPR